MKTPNFVIRLNDQDRECLRDVAKHLRRTEADSFRLIVRSFAEMMRQENNKSKKQPTQA